MIATAPWADRRRYWALTNAAVSFQQAEEISTLLLEHWTEENSVDKIAFQTALAVAYCRPFKQQPNSLRISEDWVPAEHLGQHNTLLRLRDQVNEAIMLVRGTDFMVATTPMIIRPPGLETTRSLARLLNARSSQDSHRIWLNYWGENVPPEGDYEINVSEDNDAFLIPLSWSPPIPPSRR
jgi:hypothetical protein